MLFATMNRRVVGCMAVGLALTLGACELAPTRQALEFCGQEAAATTATASNSALFSGRFLDHIVLSDKKGRIVPSGLEGVPDRCTEPPKVAGQDYAGCQLDRVLTALKARLDAAVGADAEYQQAIRLVVFIHGGLNGLEATAWRAGNQVPAMEADGVYPIFLGWDSSGPNSYGDQLLNVRQGQRADFVPDDARIVLPHQLAAPLYLFGDLMEVIARAPSAWSDQTVNLLNRQLADNDMLTDDVYRTSPKNAQIFYRDARWDDDTKFIRHGWYLATSPGKAATVPFVDSLGNAGWENMLRRTRVVFWTPENHTPRIPDSDTDSASLGTWPSGGTGAFARFLRELERLLRQPAKNAPDRPYRDFVSIDLIAHSMGSIIANDIVRYFDIEFDNIVYMAAASTIRDFTDSVAVHMAEQARGSAPGTALTLHGDFDLAGASELIGRLRIAGDPGPRQIRYRMTDNLGRTVAHTALETVSAAPPGDGPIGQQVTGVAFDGPNRLRVVRLEADILHPQADDRLILPGTLTAGVQLSGEPRRQTCFFNLSLHPDLDAQEVNALGLLPGGSLLEWIDAYYNKSPSDRERTLGKWLNVRNTLFLEDDAVTDRMVFTVFGHDGPFPVRHGDFDDVFTRQSGLVMPRLCTGYPDLKNEDVTFKYWMRKYWTAGINGGGKDARREAMRGRSSGAGGGQTTAAVCIARTAD